MAIDQQSSTAAPTRFRLPSGEIAAELGGSPTAPLVIGVPGLSANLRSFDVIFDALDPQRHRHLAYDPRGRGHSDKTAAGSYGWPAHAADIIGMADQLGAETFDLVGWSMGTWIAMKVCELAPGRVRRLVLIDGGGSPDESAKVPIYAGVERLGTVYPSFEEFSSLVQSIGVFVPWSSWEPYFRYELMEVEGGLAARTPADAAWEDENYRMSQDAYALWQAVTMPALLIRASQEILPGLGYILNAEDTARFVAEVADARAVEIDAQHYNIGMLPETARAIADFLDE
jgi:pimeloyl-ACP methyl ester carboxylesterase